MKNKTMTACTNACHMQGGSSQTRGGGVGSLGQHGPQLISLVQLQQTNSNPASSQSPIPNHAAPAYAPAWSTAA